MTELRKTDRRTVLKSLSATALGGSFVAGAGSTDQPESHTTNHTTTVNENTIEIDAEHDHHTNDHRFDFSTTEVPSGWVTITFNNQTDRAHFVSLYRLPQAAIDAADEAGEEMYDFYHEHVTRPFQYLMDDIAPYKNPNPDDLSDKYSEPEEDNLFPAWSGDLVPSSGVGLTSGHRTSTTTVELEPGEYYTECYVKNDNEEFHAYNGMADVITVTDDQAGTEPDPSVEVSLSTVDTDSDTGLRSEIEFDDDVEAGQHTVAVRFEDQQAFQNLGGHDVHLVRLDADTTLDDVNGWLNWMAPGQLVADGTEPGTFLGGAEDYMTPALLERAESGNGNGGGAAKTAYFEVTLNPGAYALVSEVPNPREKGLLEPFSIPFAT